MIRLGVAGWAYADWEGPVYPRPRPAGLDPLAFLAEYLDLMEVNATFYALPRPAAVASWLARVEPFPDFRLSAKLPRDLTHGSGPAPAAVAEFRAALAPLLASPRLFALLAQFPFSFAPGPGAFERVRGLQAALGDLPLVFELRRREWFEPPWRARLVEAGVACADLDLPPHPRHPPPEPVPGGPRRYLRLHGRNAAAWFDPRAGRDQRYDHRYLPAELDEVKVRMRRLGELGRETAVVANNHYRGQAVAAALALKAAVAGGRVPMPTTLLAAFPDLGPLARPRGQLPLFD